MTPRLYTASWSALYAHHDRLDVQPVRISRGVPKFWPEAADFPAVELLMPDGWMLRIADFEKFGRCFRRKLHIAGMPAVMAALDAIPGVRNRLALVCFEADHRTCHRDHFARWWFGKTGELIDEWQPPILAKTTHRPSGQLPGQLELDTHAPSGAERTDP
jgi:hypothetical protein